jgi:chitinase
MNPKHTRFVLLAAFGAAIGCTVPGADDSSSGEHLGGTPVGGSGTGSSAGTGSGSVPLGSGTGGATGSSGSGSGATGSSGSGSGESGSGSGATGSSGSGSSGGSGTGSGVDAGTAPAGLVFSPYKDTSINMNWNTNAIMTNVSGAATPLTADLLAAGGSAITLAFATGECGSENWAGVGGAAMATENVPTLAQSGAKYIISTGGAAGSFTCGSDAGFSTFVNRWASSGLVGVDFDIEAGQSESVIQALVARIQTAHGSFPGLRFSLTIATLANNNGSSTAESIGSGVPDSLNVYGDEVLAAVASTFGSTWPSYVTVDLMVMDYGAPSDGVCVVSGGECQMAQSAIQAAYNLHDKYGVPYGSIELTPMIGQNDASSEQFTLADADTVAGFAISQGLAGVHYWSYDRDVDCAAGSASATCSSMGSGYGGANGYLKRFLAAGLK